jgi:probable addiction module antidote protein
MADVNRVGRTCAMLTANWLGLPSAATTELVTATGILGIAVKAGSNEAAALVGSHLIEDRDGAAYYLDAVLEDGDPDLLKAALGDIARAKGMTQIAHAASLGRTNLYKALSPEGNPEFVTVARVLKALGLRLSIVV